MGILRAIFGAVCVSLMLMGLVMLGSATPLKDLMESIPTAHVFLGIQEPKNTSLKSTLPKAVIQESYVSAFEPVAPRPQEKL